MSSARLAALIVLAAVPAYAQPIIIPLEPQPKPVTPPIASAPPVAPPIAAPTQPESAIARREPGARDSDEVQEEASQPAPRPK